MNCQLLGLQCESCLELRNAERDHSLKAADTPVDAHILGLLLVVAEQKFRDFLGCVDEKAALAVEGSGLVAATASVVDGLSAFGSNPKKGFGRSVVLLKWFHVGRIWGMESCMDPELTWCGRLAVSECHIFVLEKECFGRLGASGHTAVVAGSDDGAD